MGKSEGRSRAAGVGTEKVSAKTWRSSGTKHGNGYGRGPCLGKAIGEGIGILCDENLPASLYLSPVGWFWAIYLFEGWENYCSGTAVSLPLLEALAFGYGHGRERLVVTCPRYDWGTDTHDTILAQLFLFSHSIYSLCNRKALIHICITRRRNSGTQDSQEIEREI